MVRERGARWPTSTRWLPSTQAIAPSIEHARAAPIAPDYSRPVTIVTVTPAACSSRIAATSAGIDAVIAAQQRAVEVEREQAVHHGAGTLAPAAGAARARPAAAMFGRPAGAEPY